MDQLFIVNFSECDHRIFNIEYSSDSDFQLESENSEGEVQDEQNEGNMDIIDENVGGSELLDEEGISNLVDSQQQQQQQQQTTAPRVYSLLSSAITNIQSRYLDPNSKWNRGYDLNDPFIDDHELKKTVYSSKSKKGKFFIKYGKNRGEKKKKLNSRKRNQPEGEGGNDLSNQPIDEYEQEDLNSYQERLTKQKKKYDKNFTKLQSTINEKLKKEGITIPTIQTNQTDNEKTIEIEKEKEKENESNNEKETENEKEKEKENKKTEDNKKKKEIEGKEKEKDNVIGMEIEKKEKEIQKEEQEKPKGTGIEKAKEEQVKEEEEKKIDLEKPKTEETETKITNQQATNTTANDETNKKIEQKKNIKRPLWNKTMKKLFNKCAYRREKCASLVYKISKIKDRIEIEKKKFVAQKMDTFFQLIETISAERIKKVGAKRIYTRYKKNN
ncbi:hypothetical protein M0812_19613 [Anaeramoeba flamelloides]|uniref:Hpc2-related domain-containing protein n=1 Tax=Anaeramoeba flamelloides TaxID=1746091 RepID=A0AAV7Z2Z3_9EUKA|nr:hypothetical protein M0812_19613 [Anaeramoeba flamelloides]